MLSHGYGWDGGARWALVFSRSVFLRFGQKIRFVWTKNKICLTYMCDVYSIAGELNTVV